MVVQKNGLRKDTERGRERKDVNGQRLKENEASEEIIFETMDALLTTVHILHKSLKEGLQKKKKKVLNLKKKWLVFFQRFILYI